MINLQATVPSFCLVYGMHMQVHFFLSLDRIKFQFNIITTKIAAIERCNKKKVSAFTITISAKFLPRIFMILYMSLERWIDKNSV